LRPAGWSAVDRQMTDLRFLGPLFQRYFPACFAAPSSHSVPPHARYYGFQPRPVPRPRRDSLL
jgi:hypothetical protein